MKKKKSYKGKKQYGIYANEGRFYINKKRKLIKHTDNNPHDEQAESALMVIQESLPRKKPYQKGIHNRLLQRMAKITKGIIKKHQYIKGSKLTKAIKLATI